MFAAVGTNKLVKKKSILEDQNKDLKQQNLATEVVKKVEKNNKNHHSLSNQIQLQILFRTAK